MPFKLGPWEIGLLLVIILIIFGVGKLPQIGSMFGKGVREFKKGTSGEDKPEEEAKTSTGNINQRTAALELENQKLRLKALEEENRRLKRSLSEQDKDR